MNIRTNRWVIRAFILLAFLLLFFINPNLWLLICCAVWAAYIMLLVVGVYFIKNRSDIVKSALSYTANAAILGLLSAVIIAVVAITITFGPHARRELISRNDKLVAEVLSGGERLKNNSEYQLKIEEEAVKDYRLFQKNFDSSAIKLDSALPQYSRCDYIIMPKESSIKPFAVLIQAYDETTHVVVYNKGVDRLIENYKNRIQRK